MYYKRSIYQSNNYKFQPYDLLAEYLYNRKCELESELNYQVDYILRYRNKPSATEILHLYDLQMKYNEFCLICADIFDIINISNRTIIEQSNQSSAKKYSELR